jgi:hypothetical protein
MAESTLHQVQRLVEQLSPHEQAQVLASLALRMAQMVASISSPAPVTPPETAGHGRSSSVLAMPSPPVIRQRQTP